MLLTKGSLQENVNFNDVVSFSPGFHSEESLPSPERFLYFHVCVLLKKCQMFM